jgi:S1-C subfamily serine protease
MSSARYSQLAPFSLTNRLKLTIEALKFFHPIEYQEKCKVLGKKPVENRSEPFTARDFVRYLELSGILIKAKRYSSRVSELLTRLEQKKLLENVGRSSDAFLGTQYYFLLELTNLQKNGTLWLASVFGPEFLYYGYGSSTVQITGTKTDGAEHAGTGLVIAPTWLLTCAHVLSDMNVHDQQTFFGSSYRIIRKLSHPKVDVGIVEVTPPMQMLPDIGFRDPIVGESVVTLGYPRVPLSREAALVMQRGEVTNPSITLFDGRTVFLYSAIARPGNSGGPIISETGHVVGIVTEELFEKADDFRMPFHAGIQTKELVRAIADLGRPVTLPVESYE